MIQKGLCSIILMSYNSSDRIFTCYKRIKELFDREQIPFEFVIMDDGSKDNSYEVALELERSADNVSAYALSRNFTSHYSLFAGLSVCKGACAVPIPDDEQKPYELIVEMYRLWEAGEKIIIPHRIVRDDPKVSKFFSQSFYKAMNALTDIKFPSGGADACFIDREIIDILNEKIHPINTSTVSEILRLGFSPYYLPYSRPLSTNTKSRWSFKKKWKLAKDVFFSSSSFPIRLITYCGLFFSLLSMLMIIAFIVIKIFNLERNTFIFNENVRGWTSLIIAISFFGGLILFSLGIISEYILLIYEEVKGRPGYIIKQKSNTNG